MFQAPKKSEFSQLPSFGQIANSSLQAGNPLASSNFSSTTSSFNALANFTGSSSSSFRNPSLFSTSTFPSQTSSVLFSDQAKRPNLPSNLFANVTTITTTTTKPHAGIFSTGTTPTTTTAAFTTFPSSPPSPVFASNVSSGSFPTRSAAFGVGSKTASIGSTPNYFGIASATSSSGSVVPVFGQSISKASSTKSNPFGSSSSSVLFSSPKDGFSIQTSTPFTTNKSESALKGAVFSSQLSPSKSAVPVHGWGSHPSEQQKTHSHQFSGTTTGQTVFASTVPTTNLFQSSTTSALFQPQTGSSVFSKKAFGTSSSVPSKSFASGTDSVKVFFSSADNSLQKLPTVTSSAFSRLETSQSAGISQTVSKVFGSSSDGSFTSTSAAKDTKAENVGLFGKPIESQSTFTKSVSSSSEISKDSSTSYEVGLFGKLEKKIESAPESLEVPVSQPAKVGPFGKQLASRELESDDRMTRKRNVSPKRSWSKHSHGRHGMESEGERFSPTKSSKTMQFGKLYSEAVNQQKPTSSRLSNRNEKDRVSSSRHSKRTPWADPDSMIDKSADESKLSRRTRISRQMSEDDESKVVLVCKNVPSAFNKGAILRKHFARFGEITRLTSYPQKRSANVRFKNHESAYNAKYNGTVLAPGVRIQIYWYAGSQRTSTSYRDLDAAPPEPEIESLPKPKSKSATATKKRSWLSDEVQEELELMVGTNDIKEELVHTLDRPADMPFVPPPPLAPSTSAAPSSQTLKSSHRPKTISSISQSSTTVPEKKVPFAIAEVKKTEHMMSLKSAAALPLRKTENIGSSDNESASGESATRVKLLDYYDRVVRKQIKKKSDLASASVLIGECPDMCPEKERYDREAKRRLHPFEILAETEKMYYPKADHAKVVKEYSRSSADQEEPLPHELRPATVLVRTMTYLLTEIGNKGKDGTWPEWYDFLWDRTRGIRKDITQQMMCNVEAVALLEKCSRFHIFSAERLCEEEMSAFSNKINDENLTKCLQSLKYLYADMERKHKIYFETEAEFRAYVVLLNLNKGDMLREVQTLRPDILSSPEIHFALQVYTAISSNNYIKFFKLIRKATFLNACILHRYFSQVRSKALMILIRALSFSSRPVPYPLTKLVETLGFESATQAAVFCKHYGFIVENDDVLLDRASFVEPETAPAPQRSLMLVEVKNNQTIGDVINGGPLPAYELVTPGTSFDKDGNLKPEIFARYDKKEKAETFEKKVKAESATLSEIPQQSSALQPKSFIVYQQEMKLEPQAQTELIPFQEQPQQAEQFTMHKTLRQQEDMTKESEMLEDISKLPPKDNTDAIYCSSQDATVPTALVMTSAAPSETSARVMVPTIQSTAPTARVVAPAIQSTAPAARVVAPAIQSTTPAVRVVAPAMQPMTATTGVVTTTTQSKPMHPARMKQLAPLEIIKEFACEMFLEVIKEVIPSIAEESIQDVENIVAEICNETQNSIVDDYLRELCQKVCEEISVEQQQQLMEALAKEKKLLEEKKKAEAVALKKKKEEEAKKLAQEKRRLAEQQEKEKRVQRVTEEISQEIVGVVLTEVLKKISDEQIEEVEKQLREQTIEECIQQAKTDIFNEVISEMGSIICQQVYTTDVELRLKELDELEHCVTLYRISKVLQQWKRACIIQRQRKQCLETFPACPSLVPAANQLKKLCGPEHSGIADDFLLLNKRARLSLESPISISRREAYLPVALTLCRLRRDLTQQKAWYPLDLNATVGKELQESSNWESSDWFGSSKDKCDSRLYWKLLISFPELDEEADDVYTLSSLELCDWLKSKLSKGARPESTLEDKVSVLSLYKLQLNEEIGSYSGRKMLHFCARSVTGVLDTKDIEQTEIEKSFLGSSGLLYILPVMQITEDEDEEEIYWLEEQTRLATLLQAKPIKPSLPLAVLMPRHKKLSHLSLEEFVAKMNLQNFIDQELISTVSLFTLPFCLKTPGIDVEHSIAEDMLTGSLRWLASRIPTQPLLEKKRFRDYVEDFLSEEFYSRVLYNQKIRQSEGYLHQSPHVLIDLYNSLIDHLTACATDKELLKYSWPVTEFQTDNDCYDLPSAYWNSEEHLVGIGNQLLLLKLPEFQPTDEYNEDWSKAVEDVWNYIKSIIGEGSNTQAVELVSKVRNLLVRIESRFSEACLLEYGQEGCMPTAENIAWLDVILYCINHLLMTTPYLDTISADDQECPQEIEVMYRKSELTSFKPDAAWNDAASEKSMREGPTLKATYILSISKMNQTKQEECSSEPAAATKMEPSKVSVTPDLMSSNAKSIDLLKMSVNAEKLNSQSFGDFLERSLHEGFLEDEQSFSYLHSGDGDSPTIKDCQGDESGKNVDWSCDPLIPHKKSVDHEDEISLNFETTNSFQDKITMLNNELESFRKSNSFMECCLSTLTMDPFLPDVDMDQNEDYMDQDESIHDC